MNRRTEIKLENAKIFAKKYIFSSNFVVRNTLALMTAATVVGTAVIATNVVGSKEDTKTVSNLVAESVKEDDGYTIYVGNDSYIADGTVNNLYARLGDEGVLTASNDTTNLTKSEYDMTGKFIVSTDGLNLRAEASEEGNIIAVLNTGDTGEVVGTDGDWTMVASAGNEGYVKTEYILTDDAATEVAKKAADEGISYRDAIGVEEVVVVAEVDTEASTEAVAATTKTTEPVATTEQTTQAPTEATTEATTQAPTEATTEATTQATAVASSDLYLLAAIVYAEAGGESYEGQLAVANVVLNRVYSGAWGGSSISAVIYAPNQFTAIYSSSFTNALSTGGSSTSLQAAQDALNGSNNIGGYTSFRPSWNVDTSSLGSYTQIGNHVFY